MLFARRPVSSVKSTASEPCNAERPRPVMLWLSLYLAMSRLYVVLIVAFVAQRLGTCRIVQSHRPIPGLQDQVTLLRGSIGV